MFSVHRDHRGCSLPKVKVGPKKLVSLLSSFLVALSAGSNYGFSLYAVQLGEALHLSSTQLNIVGAAGNFGMYATGPFLGRFIDLKGPKLALVFGAFFVGVGYGGLSLSYTRSWDVNSTWGLAFLSFLTGLGNCAGFTAAMNAQAKSWGKKVRGSATALVLSGFGLSAFTYSVISHTLFPGNTANFLRLLSFGAAAVMLLGAVFVEIMPPTADEDAPRSGFLPVNGSRGHYAAVAAEEEEEEEEEDAGQEVVVPPRVDPERPLRSSAFAPGTARSRSRATSRDHALAGDMDALDMPEASVSEETEDDEAEAKPGSTFASDGRASHQHHGSEEIDFHGSALFLRAEFWLLFFVVSLISGSGLLLMNNIGTITKTLYEFRRSPLEAAPNLFMSSSAAASTRVVDQSSIVKTGLPPVLPSIVPGFVPGPGNALGSAIRVAKAAVRGGTLDVDTGGELQQLQARQVSLISLGNFVGRIFAGVISDFFAAHWGVPRIYFLLFVCSAAAGVQLLASSPFIITVHKLLTVSSLSGIYYGMLFGLGPLLTYEWFGMKHFSANWGWMSFSPILAANIFNYLFGRIYDSHVPANSPRHVCPDGPSCYDDVFHITFCACLVAFLLSAAAAWRHERNQRGRHAALEEGVPRLA